MSDLEYDVLDEMYFIQHFDGLKEATQLEDKELRDVLVKMLKKGWIRCYRSASEEIPLEEIDIEAQYFKYYYLASKSGLKAHTSAE